MGNVVEDFIESFIYNVPAQKRFKNTKVVKWKKVSSGTFDDWDSGVAGTYLALIYKNNKPYAIVSYKVELDERYDDEGNQPYEDFADAATIKMGKVRLIKKVPNILK